MDFSKILDDWDKQTAQAAGKKACKKAEDEARSADPTQNPPARPRAVSSVQEVKKPSLPKKGAGMEEWLALYGLEDKDSGRELKKGSAIRSTDTGDRAELSSREVNPISAWLRVHGVQDKDSERSRTENPSVIPGHEAAERRRRLREKRPDAVLDLHGLTSDEAWDRLSSFFNAALSQGAEKVLVVHGKGNHSDGEAILKKRTKDFIESCPFAGESGQADARLGGAGATWVLIKKDHRSR